MKSFKIVSDAREIEIGCVPEGGTSGQVLIKSSDLNYAVEWANLESGGETEPIGSISNEEIEELFDSLL